MTTQATCRSCGKEIDWTVMSATGKAMPVDHDSAGKAGGTLAVWRTDDCKLWCRALKKGEQPEGREKLATAHWSTCPNAKDHKR